MPSLASWLSILLPWITDGSTVTAPGLQARREGWESSAKPPLGSCCSPAHLRVEPSLGYEHQKRGQSFQNLVHRFPSFVKILPEHCDHPRASSHSQRKCAQAPGFPLCLLQKVNIFSLPLFFINIFVAIFMFAFFPKSKPLITTQQHKGKETAKLSFPRLQPKLPGRICVTTSSLSCRPQIPVLT